MPRHRTRPRRPRPHAGRLVASALVLAAACAPCPAHAQGDPDIPAAHEPVTASRSFLARDLDRLASSRSLRLLVTGGALALAVRGEESADRAETFLDRPAFDGSLDVGTVYGHGAILAGGALGLLATGWITEDPNLRGAGSEMARSLAYTSLVVTGLKIGVGRTRPNGGRWSFPSGHTAAAFSVAPVLSRRFGRAATIPAYAIAVATGLGRMEDRKHYLSDVLAGAAIGLAVGHAVAGPDDHADAPRFLVGPGGVSLTAHF